MDGALLEEALVELGLALREQERTDELQFLEVARRAASGDALPSDAGAGNKKLRKALADFISQSGWKDERVSDQGGEIYLNLSELDVPSLEKLRPLNLRSLDLSKTKATDLAALLDMPLEELRVAQGTSDLSPLPVKRLHLLDLRGSSVSDLSPLAGAPLEELLLDGTPVESLEPLRKMPLRVLSVDASGVKDFSVLATLDKLEELSLPYHAALLPVAGLASLSKVRHPRFQAEGWIEGETFKQLSKQSDEAWEKWKVALQGLRATDLGPHCVTVVEETFATPRLPMAFDLDLRGTDVTDLSALRNIPVNRLYLDTTSKPMSLSPLRAHPTLQHLVLTGANVPSLQGVLDRQELKSIILSAETADVRRLLHHSYIKWAGYTADPSTRLPLTTVEELFAERTKPALKSPVPGRNHGPYFVFDTAGPDGDREVKLWKLSPEREDGADGLVWRPDPPKEGGLGGGYVEFFERSEDGLTSYFVVPKTLYAAERSEVTGAPGLYGSSLGFYLRSEGDGTAMADSDLVVTKGKSSMHFSLPGSRPAREFRSFIVPLKEGEGWRKNSREGDEVTEAEMKEFLNKVGEIKIRAEYFRGGSYERTSLDYVALWSARETALRAKEEAWDEKAKDDLLGLAVQSGKIDQTVFEGWWRSLGAQSNPTPRTQTIFGLTRVSEYQGRSAPLLVRTLSDREPASITLKPQTATVAGTTLRFLARGAPSGQGVLVKILQGDKILREDRVGGAGWREFSLELPQAAAGDGTTLCVIEIWPEGQIDQYCFVARLELVTPQF
jgi:hypothetical protein